MNTSARTTRNARAAALHEQGDTRRILVLSVDGGAPRVEVTRSFGANEDDALRAALRDLGDPPLVRVIPGAGAITRVVQLPSGAEDDIRAALDLIAEAELPASIPPHRRAAGVIPSARNNGAISAMLLGWPPATAPQRITENECYTTETAALNALLASDPDDSAAAYVDPARGSVALFTRGVGSCRARTVREDPADADRWRETVATAAGSIGLDAHGDARSSPSLLIDESDAARALERIDGARADRQWLDQYGIALGAALGATSDNPAIAPLFDLSPEPRAQRASRITRIREYLDRPTVAVAVIIVALLLMLLAPLAGAFARHRILLAKTGGLEAQRADERAVDRRLALYNELERNTWPMTKLVADLSGLIPVGVTVESIQLIHGDEISVAGTAESADLLNTMQRTIDASGVFDDATLPRIERSTTSAAGPVAFDLAARVLRPYADPRNAEDFSDETLAVRMYGRDAVARYPEDMTTLVSPDPGEAPGATRAQSRTLAASSADDADDESSAPRQRARANDRETQTVPEPLTDARIESMDRSQLVREFGLRRKASSYPELSAEDEQRLKDELEKIRAELRDGRGG